MKPQGGQWFHLNENPRHKLRIFTLKKIEVAIENSVFKNTFEEHLN